MTTNEAALVEELARLNRTIKSHAKAIARMTKVIDAHFAHPEPLTIDVGVDVPLTLSGGVPDPAREKQLTAPEIKLLSFGVRVTDSEGRTWARSYLDQWLLLDAPGSADSATLEVFYGPITLAAK